MTSTTRRGLLTLAAATALDSRAFADSDEISRSAEAIHMEPVIPASPARVYAALTDGRQFHEVMRRSSEATQAMGLRDEPPVIAKQPGGEFRLFGGHIVGRQIELVPPQRVVQAWRSVDWLPGVYSIARFELKTEDSGTRVVFDHTGFPAGQAEHLASGWTAHYWTPLRSYLS